MGRIEEAVRRILGRSGRLLATAAETLIDRVSTRLENALTSGSKVQST